MGKHLSSIQASFRRTLRVGLALFCGALLASSLAIGDESAENYDCTDLDLPHPGGDDDNQKKVRINLQSQDFVITACAGSWVKLQASGAGDCDIAGTYGGNCSPSCSPSKNCAEDWNNSNNDYEWSGLEGVVHSFDGDLNEIVYIRTPHTGYPQDLVITADRDECGQAPDAVGVEPRTVTISVHGPTSIEHYTIAKYYTLGATFETWDAAFEEATDLVFLRDDMENDLTQTDPQLDTHCCVGADIVPAMHTFQSPPGLTLLTIDDATEESAVLDDVPHNVKIVEAINYCGQAVTGGLGCSTFGQDSVALPQLTNPPIITHEKGHTASLKHSQDGLYGTYWTSADDHSSNFMQKNPVGRYVVPFQCTGIKNNN